MPAAAHVEKEGCFTNTQRLVQFRDKALEPPGDARSELWFMHHLAKRVKEHYAGSTQARDWPIVNLRWDYPERGADARARCRGGDEGDQRLRRRDRAAAVAVHRPAQRRLDRLRLLDLLGHLRRRRQPGQAPRPGRSDEGGRPRLARVGVGMAGEPPHALQPRVRRSRGPPVEREKEVRVVGRGGAALDRLRRPRLPGRQAAGLSRARGRQGHGRDQRGRPVHDDGRRPRAGCLRPAACSTGRCRPTTSRSSRRCTTSCTRKIDADPAAIRWRRPENPQHAVEDPRYPDRGHHLPAHRAAHGGRHEPQGPVAGRAPARDVRRDRPRARARARHRGRRLDDDRDRARRDRGARAGDRAHAPAANRRPARAPDRPAVALGLLAAVSGRLRERPHRDHRRPQRLDPGVEGVHVRGPRGAAARTVDRAPEGRRRAASSGGARPGRPPGREPTGDRQEAGR